MKPLAGTSSQPKYNGCSALPGKRSRCWWTHSPVTMLTQQRYERRKSYCKPVLNSTKFQAWKLACWSWRPGSMKGSKMGQLNNFYQRLSKLENIPILASDIPPGSIVLPLVPLSEQEQAFVLAIPAGVKCDY